MMTQKKTKVKPKTAIEKRDASLGKTVKKKIPPKRKVTPHKKAILNKKALVEAMHNSLGIVTDACKIVNLSRKTYYEYYNTDTEFKKAIDQIPDMVLDFAESQLHKLVREGNVAATLFLLKTKGKKRGYIERQEIHAHVKSYDQGEWDGEETPEAYLQRTLSQTTQ